MSTPMTLTDTTLDALAGAIARVDEMVERMCPPGCIPTPGQERDVAALATLVRAATTPSPPPPEGPALEVPGDDFAIIPEARLDRWREETSGWGVGVSLIVQEAIEQIRKLQAFARSVRSLDIVHALSQSRAEVEWLRGALERCSARFAFYEQQHRAKGTADADIKAEANRGMVEMIRAALSPVAEGGGK